MAVQARVYPESLALPMCALQDWMVDNPVSVSELGADFCFEYHQPSQPQKNQFLQQPGSQIYGFGCNLGPSSSSSSTCDSSLFMSLSQSLDAHLEMQRREVDCILQIQGERLRSALQEQGKNQLSILLKIVESKTSCLMRQKEEDLAQATRRNMELEAFLKKAQNDSESWQQVAIEKEAIIVDLNKSVEQVRERLFIANNRAQDSESFCRGSCEREEEEEQQSQKTIGCKRCNSRSSCVVFLPCRHLCSCKSCEAFLGFCPVCQSAKEASMEVFLV